MLRNITVFQGGWSIEEAEQVCSEDGGLESWEVLDVLDSLVDKSLVIADPLGQTTRYRILESLRQYGREKLEEAGTLDAVCRTHARAFAALAHDLGARLRGPDGRGVMARLSVEQLNLRAAMLFALQNPSLSSLTLQMVADLWLFWWSRGFASEGLHLARTAFDQSTGEEDARVRLDALCGLAWLAYSARDLDASFAAARKLREEATQLDSPAQLAFAFNTLGVLHDHVLEREKSLEFYEASLEINKQLPGGGRSGANLHNIALLLLKLGRYDDADARLLEGIDLSEKIHDIDLGFFCLSMRGQVALAVCDFEKARVLTEQALVATREQGLVRRVADILAIQGFVELGGGRLNEAGKCFSEAEHMPVWEQISAVGLSELHRGLALLELEQNNLTSAREYVRCAFLEAMDEQELSSFGLILVTLALIDSKEKLFATAAKVLGMASGWFELLPEALSPYDRVWLERAEAEARAGLGDQRYEELRKDGAQRVPKVGPDYEKLLDAAKQLHERIGDITSLPVG
jgi:non-specific serine/threonine protein kinase